jgi:hypothetical protein
MKKYIFLALLTTLFCHEVYSQTKIISLPNYYKGKGVIFNKDYKSLLKIDNYSKSFTPLLKEVSIVEDVFLNQIKTKKSFKKSVKKEFCNYYRQYLGYINKNNEKIIVVNMLNFRRKSKAKKNFEDWDKEFILGFGEFYEENQFLYKVNLSKKDLQLW